MITLSRNQQIQSLKGIQAGRAAAALLVLLFHASGSIFGLQKYGGTKPYGAIFDFGNAGVNFFFVLSGFIILYAHAKDLDQKSRFLAYAWKRFRRIYPIYWIILLAVIPIYFLVPTFGFGYETEPAVLSSSFLLIHIGTKNAVLIVSWTLFHEVLFYGLFAAMIWNLRAGLVIMAVWLVASLASLALIKSPDWLSFYIDPLHLLFGMGMAVAFLVRRVQVPNPGLLLWSGLCLFVLMGMERAYWNILSWAEQDFLFGLATVPILAGLVGLERAGRLPVPEWLVLVGEASYVVYLTHFLFLSAFAKGLLPVLRRIDSPDTISFWVLAGLALLAGVLVHVLLERPLLNWLGRPREFLPSLVSGSGSVSLTTSATVLPAPPKNALTVDPPRNDPI